MTAPLRDVDRLIDETFDKFGPRSAADVDLEIAALAIAEAVREGRTWWSGSAFYDMPRGGEHRG